MNTTLTETQKRKQIENYFEAIMKLLDLDLKDPNNAETPFRLTKLFYDEVFKNRNSIGFNKMVKSMAFFPNPNFREDKPNTNEVTVKDIKFFSTCAHHWLPFFGTVTVTYIPRKEIIGLSKIPRVVKYFSKRPQVQEKLGSDIAEFLFSILDPETVVVKIKAKHTCVEARGIETECETETEYTILRSERVPQDYE